MLWPYCFLGGTTTNAAARVFFAVVFAVVLVVGSEDIVPSGSGMGSVSEKDRKTTHVAPDAADAGFSSQQGFSGSIRSDGETRLVGPPERNVSGFASSPFQNFVASLRSNHGRGNRVEKRRDVVVVVVAVIAVVIAIAIVIIMGASRRGQRARRFFVEASSLRR